MLYLFFLGLTTRHKGALVLSGLALGLGSGHQTNAFFFFCPGLAMVVLLVCLDEGQKVNRLVVSVGGSALAAFLLFGAYMFVVNQVTLATRWVLKRLFQAQTGGQTGQS